MGDAGLFCDLLIPDVLAVPTTENGWSLLTMGEQLLVRQDTFKGIQGEQTWLLPTLSHFTAQHDGPINITNYAGIDLTDTPNINVNDAPLDLPMQVLAKEAMTSNFNLLQGDYKVKRQTNTLWSQWRVAAVLAVLVLCTSLIDKGVTLYQLKAENAALKAQIDSAVKQGFPNLGAYRNVTSVRTPFG